VQILYNLERLIILWFIGDTFVEIRSCSANIVQLEVKAHKTGNSFILARWHDCVFLPN